MESNVMSRADNAPDPGAPAPGAQAEPGVPAEPKVLVQSYLEAAQALDIGGCVRHYAPDATLTFMSGVFEGSAAIEEWHKERFAANMRFVKIDAIKVKGEVVTVDAVITSDRLKAWKLGTLGGRATFRVRDGQIRETTFGLRLHNPLEGW